MTPLQRSCSQKVWSGSNPKGKEQVTKQCQQGIRLGVSHFFQCLSKVLAFAFGLSAEIERDLISQRIKEALARKKSEGVILGRPLGKKSSHVKLSGHEKEIQDLLEKHISKSAIGRIFGVNRMTVDSFLKNRMPQQVLKKKNKIAKI